MNNIKPIAIYLPQYHPTPENDKWWGKGFTEWTNVAKAKPLYKGHQQPKLPADLGFYDLRLAETRAQQATMAKEYGVYGFCYYHYWFGNNRQLLERPFLEVLQSGEPDLPFMLCWANQTWSGVWFGETDKILMQQEYPGEADMLAHFNYLLPAFKDKRYITVQGKPVFIVYDMQDMPDAKMFSDFFNAKAKENGLPGLHLVAGNITRDNWDPKEHGFDAKISNTFNQALTELRQEQSGILQKVLEKSGLQKPVIIDHKSLVEKMDFSPQQDKYPIIVPNWDNTPRSGNRGFVFDKSTPELFSQQLKKAANSLSNHDAEDQFIFIKSWNEWAEGNYLEPDVETGHGYLEEIRKFVTL